MSRTGKLSLGVSLGLAIALAAASNVSAAAIYSYAGNNFDTFVESPFPPGAYDNTMSVTGSFTLGSFLAPNLSNQDITASVLSFSFNDGRQTFTEASGLGVIAFVVSTSGSGDLTEWFIDLGTSSGQPRNTISTVNRGVVVRDRGEQIFTLLARDTGQVSGSPGVWTVVPEPGTAILLGLGLVVLGSVRRARGA